MKLANNYQQQRLTNNNVQIKNLMNH